MALFQPLRKWCSLWGLSYSWNGDSFTIRVDGKTYTIWRTRLKGDKYQLHLYVNGEYVMSANNYSDITRYIMQDSKVYFQTEKKRLGNDVFQYQAGKCRIFTVHLPEGIIEILKALPSIGWGKSSREALRILLRIGLQKLMEEDAMVKELVKRVLSRY